MKKFLILLLSYNFSFSAEKTLDVGSLLDRSTRIRLPEVISSDWHTSYESGLLIFSDDLSGLSWRWSHIPCANRDFSKQDWRRPSVLELSTVLGHSKNAFTQSLRRKIIDTRDLRSNNENLASTHFFSYNGQNALVFKKVPQALTLQLCNSYTLLPANKFP